MPKYIIVRNIIQKRKEFAMFNRAKVTGLVISVMAVFFIISCGVSIPPADSSASQPPGHPENISQDKVGDEELLPQASLNLSDSAETSSEVTSPDGNRDPAPVVENEGTSSEQLLEYLRWKHNAGLSLPEEATIVPETGVSQPLSDKDRLRAYLYWAHMRED